MKKILICLCCFALSFTLFAQENNSNYDNFLEYKALAEESFNAADYTKSIEYAQTALEYGNSSLADLENNAPMDQVAQADGATPTDETTKMQSEIDEVKSLSSEALAKKALENIKELESLGGNTNAYTKNAYADSSEIYKMFNDEYSNSLTNSNFSLDNTSYSTGFQNSIYISTSAIGMKESINIYDSLKKENIIVKNDTNDATITEIYNSSMASLADHDFNTVDSNIEKANNLMNNIKDYTISENIHNLAYLTYKNALDNKLDATLKGKAYNMLYQSQEALSMKNYEEVKSQSMAVINLLAENSYATPILPKYYKVRLLKRRDSLSRISGYNFVYDDIKQWNEIYQLNKDSMVNPANPNLIEPDQLLEIPTKMLELRDGEYVVNKEYLIVKGRATEAPILEPLAVRLEPATDDMVAEEPVTDEMVTDEMVAEEPVTDEMVTDDDMVVEEPITDEMVTDEEVTIVEVEVTEQ